MVAKVFRKVARRIIGVNADTTTVEQEQFLLDRLGGMLVLISIVNEFSRRATADERLKVFFQGVDPQLLEAHQQRFFALAFTTIDKQKAQATILRAHSHLFALGLSEHHFDIFSYHLEQTLRDRGFKEAIVAEACAVIAPLRDIFQEGAQRNNPTGKCGTDAPRVSSSRRLGSMVAFMRRSTFSLFRGSGDNSSERTPAMVA